jgi:hypothetical protein
MTAFFKANRTVKAYKPPSTKPKAAGAPPERVVRGAVGVAAKGVAFGFKLARGVLSGARTVTETADATTLRAVADLAVDEARQVIPIRALRAAA